MKNLFRIGGCGLLAVWILSSCQEATSRQVMEESVLSDDSMALPYWSPGHQYTPLIERDFPEPVYPLLPLLSLDEGGDPEQNSAGDKGAGSGQ